MGYTLSKKGLQVDKQKVLAIDLMPAPTDRKGVERLIGMVTFLARFVPSFSDVMQPIRTLLEKDSEFVWDPDFHGTAFNTIKELLKSAPVLQFFDPKAEISVQTDASSTGLGAVFLCNGLPVFYISRALSKTEIQYAQIEKETLSMLFACERLHTYLFGR